jgi:hypothetical protein
MRILPLVLSLTILSACGGAEIDSNVAALNSGGQLVFSDGDGHRWVSRSMSSVWPEEIEGTYLWASWSRSEVKFVLEEAKELMAKLDDALITGLELRRGERLVGRALIVESRRAAALRQEQENRHAFNDFIAAVFYRNDGALPGSSERCRPASELDPEAQGCVWLTP